MSQILQTKLFIPQTRPNTVPRPQLLARLDTGLGRKLTLVSAPAGFGKTTLISDWMAQMTQSASAHQENGLPQVCWLSLDPGDNTLPQFLSYFVAALQTQHPQVGTSLLSLLQETIPPDANELMTLLINDLATLSDRLLLVLDDYHEITNEAIHNAMTFLLRHVPTQLQMVLITRADPPLSLAKLRARGQMTEIRVGDLRFTETEAQTLFNENMHLGLTPEDVATLDERTEGWIASLQLAALALQSTDMQSQDQHAFVAEFAGSDRYIVDYLVGEVLDHQPPHIEAFLLQTSVLDRLCAPLCDEVRAEQAREFPSQAILEHLEATNLFLFPLDNKRCWYRYHNLFADLLRFRLQERDPELVMMLHQRAGEWFAENELVEEALAHALAAEAYEQAAHLIEQSAHEMFGNGQMLVLKQWFDVLPPDFIYTRPGLYLLQGWLLFRTGHFSHFEQHLRHPFPVYEDQLSDAMRGELFTLKAHAAFIRGEFDNGLMWGQQALTLLPVNAWAVRMPTMTALGWCHEAMGNYVEAAEYHLAIAKKARELDSLTGTVGSLSKLLQMYVELGEWQQAETTYEAVMDYVEKRGSEQLPLLGMTQIGWGMRLQRQEEWDGAERNLRQGIAMCEHWGGLRFEATKGYRVLVETLRMQGKIREAGEVLVEAEQFGLAHHVPAWALVWLQDVSLSTPASYEALTQRELDVLRLLASGKSSPQIADELVVGVSTVRTHIKRIYSKLDAHSRHEAITRAREVGLI